MLELQSTSLLFGPGLSFLSLCLSLKKAGKRWHKGTDWIRIAALYLFSDCVDLVPMQCRKKVTLKVEKQKDPFLIFL